MHKNKLISIVTPAFNCESVINDTYDALVKQTYLNWEWVVTEDFSTDNTYERLKSIASLDTRVRLFRNTENSGAAVSRNRSIIESRGDFLAFIDSDDLWLPTKLETQLRAMLDDDLDFSFTAYELVDESGVRLDKVVDGNQSRPLSYNDMLKKKATLGCSTVMLRKAAFKTIEMPLIRTGQDYGLWLRLLKTGKVAYPISSPLTQYRLMPNSISRNKFKKARRQWQIYRKLEDLSILHAMYCFSFYAWRAVFRK